MGKIRTPSRKSKLSKLSNLCIQYFGKDFEHWSWEIHSGNIEGYPLTIAAAIELPKYTKDGKLCYTDPFVSKSGGKSKSLDMCCDDAINWINWYF